eukprot:52912-Chlamydomonas_euryale.AAC.2
MPRPRILPRTQGRLRPRIAAVPGLPLSQASPQGPALSLGGPEARVVSPTLRRCAASFEPAGGPAYKHSTED